MDHLPGNEMENASIDFLKRDFDQCFQQMRHYDDQILEIVKFALTADTFIAGAALAFYRYGLDKNVDLRGPGVAMATVGFLLGIVLFSLVARNRVYFVLVTRYLNEHRAFFLDSKPLGFINRTKMYVNIQQPPYFNWRSSQALLLYVLGFLNAGLLSLGLYFIFDLACFKWTIIGFVAPISMAAQLFTAIIYLRSREGRSASRAVFGRE